MKESKNSFQDGYMIYLYQFLCKDLIARESEDGKKFKVLRCCLLSRSVVLKRISATA